ncbi:hypothetical protein [Sinorhizobium sojae]|uniref:hypothetical protein n=1 Tax=Sinorhizobium sojae TaxID=716925 RepID=UPI00054F5763|nr:hypothetical protein [Sinorhizobium sojae]
MQQFKCSTALRVYSQAQKSLKLFELRFALPKIGSDFQADARAPRSGNGPLACAPDTGAARLSLQ